jgi:hypothetical protein
MGRKPLPDDFKDLIRCLNSSDVRYLLVGGWARTMDLADAEKLEKHQGNQKF